MKLLTAGILVMMFAAVAFAPLVPAPPAITVLAQQSDLIAVAKLVSIDNSRGMIQLNLQRVLKGQPSTLTVTAAVPPLPGPHFVGETPQTFGYVPPSMAGTVGVWFLKSAFNSWQVVFPATMGMQISYSIPAGSIPAGSDALAPSGNLNQQLLAYLANWYSTLREPTRGDDSFLINCLYLHVAPDDAAPAIDSLIASPHPSSHAIGLAAAIHLGSVDALNKVADELPGLGSNPKLHRITDGIAQGNFKPGDLSTLPPIERIIRARSGLPEIDGVSSILLRKIGGKAILPLMALLLDSSEPLAQRAAAYVFARFTMYADKDGNMHEQDGRSGPFDSPANRRQMPGMSSTETPSEYVPYWKNWWRENYSKLGFSNP